MVAAFAAGGFAPAGPAQAAQPCGSCLAVTSVLAGPGSGDLPDPEDQARDARRRAEHEARAAAAEAAAAAARAAAADRAAADASAAAAKAAAETATAEAAAAASKAGAAQKAAAERTAAEKAAAERTAAEKATAAKAAAAKAAAERAAADRAARAAAEAARRAAVASPAPSARATTTTPPSSQLPLAAQPGSAQAGSAQAGSVPAGPAGRVNGLPGQISGPVAGAGQSEGGVPSAGSAAGLPRPPAVGARSLTGTTSQGGSRAPGADEPGAGGTGALPGLVIGAAPTTSPGAEVVTTQRVPQAVTSFMTNEPVDGKPLVAALLGGLFLLMLLIARELAR